jgi:ankyrin repeat protein
MSKQKDFEISVRDENLKVFQSLINNMNVNPAKNESNLLLVATFNENIKMVELLLMDKRINPKVNDFQVIKICCKSGNVKILNILLKDSRITFDEVALLIACNNGNLNIIKELLKHKKLKMHYSENLPIKMAYKYNFYDIIDFLFLEAQVRELLKKESPKLYKQLNLRYNIKNF